MFIKSKPSCIVLLCYKQSYVFSKRYIFSFIHGRKSQGTSSLTAGVGPGTVRVSDHLLRCWDEGKTRRPATCTLVEWVMCCLCESNPIFTRRRGGSKMGGGPGGCRGVPIPTVFGPFCRWLGAWVSGHWAHAWWTSLYPLFPRSFR
jgi:hypothetical protein